MQDDELSYELGPEGKGNDDVGREFVRLLTANQHRVYAYILTLVADWSAAEDILQDTCEVMWVKYGQVRPVEDFVAWAFRIAHYKVLNYVSKRAHQHVLLDSDTLDEVAGEAQQLCLEIDERLMALQRCMEQLNETDRRYLHLRYCQNLTIKQIAEEVGRPIHGMYKRLARIHDLLLRCIQRRLAGETGL